MNGKLQSLLVQRMFQESLNKLFKTGELSIGKVEFDVDDAHVFVRELHVTLTPDTATLKVEKVRITNKYSESELFYLEHFETSATINVDAYTSINMMLAEVGLTLKYLKDLFK